MGTVELAHSNQPSCMETEAGVHADRGDKCSVRNCWDEEAHL